MMISFRCWLSRRLFQDVFLSSINKLSNHMASSLGVPQKLAECGIGILSPGTGILGQSASHVSDSVITAHDAL